MLIRLTNEVTVKIESSASNEKNLQVVLNINLNELDPPEVSRTIHEIRNQTAFLSDFVRMLKTGYRLNEKQSPQFIARLEKAFSLIKSEILFACKLSKEVVQQYEKLKQEPQHHSITTLRGEACRRKTI